MPSSKGALYVLSMGQHQPHCRSFQAQHFLFDDKLFWKNLNLESCSRIWICIHDLLIKEVSSKNHLTKAPTFQFDFNKVGVTLDNLICFLRIKPNGTTYHCKIGYRYCCCVNRSYQSIKASIHLFLGRLCTY